MNHHESANHSGTVVFIHGYQDNAAVWDEVIDRLPTPGWCARAVNLRHVDDADPARRGAVLEGYRDQVLDVVHGIDASARRPLVVVGQSMGAQVAELVSLARSDVTAGLALMTPVPLAGYRLTPEQAAGFEHAAHDRTVASAAANRRALLVNDSTRVMRTLVSATIGTPPATAAQQLDAWASGHPLGDRPSDAVAPVLLIDSDDTFSTVELIRDVVAPRFADARMAHVGGAGHWPHVEQPDAVAEILTHFLASLEHQPLAERTRK